MKISKLWLMPMMMLSSITLYPMYSDKKFQQPQWGPQGGAIQPLKVSLQNIETASPDQLKQLFQSIEKRYIGKLLLTIKQQDIEEIKRCKEKIQLAAIALEWAYILAKNQQLHLLPSVLSKHLNITIAEQNSVNLCLKLISDCYLELFEIQKSWLGRPQKLTPKKEITLFLNQQNTAFCTDMYNIAHALILLLDSTQEFLLPIITPKKDIIVILGKNEISIQELIKFTQQFADSIYIWTSIHYQKFNESLDNLETNIKLLQNPPTSNPTIQNINNDLKTLLTLLQKEATPTNNTSTLKSFAKILMSFAELQDLATTRQENFLHIKSELNNLNLYNNLWYIVSILEYGWGRYCQKYCNSNIETKVSLQFAQSDGTQKIIIKTILQWQLFSKEAGFTYENQLRKLIYQDYSFFDFEIKRVKQEGIENSQKTETIKKRFPSVYNYINRRMADLPKEIKPLTEQELIEIGKYKMNQPD